MIYAGYREWTCCDMCAYIERILNANAFAYMQLENEFCEISIHNLLLFLQCWCRRCEKQQKQQHRINRNWYISKLVIDCRAIETETTNMTTTTAYTQKLIAQKFAYISSIGVRFILSDRRLVVQWYGTWFGRLDGLCVICSKVFVYWFLGYIFFFYISFGLYFFIYFCAVILCTVYVIWRSHILWRWRLEWPRPFETNQIDPKGCFTNFFFIISLFFSSRPLYICICNVCIRMTNAYIQYL